MQKAHEGVLSGHRGVACWKAGPMTASTCCCTFSAACSVQVAIKASLHSRQLNDAADQVGQHSGRQAGREKSA